MPMNQLRRRASRYRIHLIYIGLLGIGLFVILNVLQAHSLLQRQLADTTQQLQQTSEAAAGNCRARSTWPSDTTRTFQLISSGRDRHFLVHLPKDFDVSKQYPVILVFTGKGEQAKTVEQAFGINRLDAITIYPQATLGKDKTTAWQGAPYSSSADDVDFVDDILDKVEGQLCVQKSRIYSVGFSNGGGMSWVLSCQSSDRIAAFAMIAGAFYYPEKKCNAKQPAAILNVHGDEDHTIPYGGSSRRNLPDIDTWAARRAKSNGCDPSPTILQQFDVSTTTTWQRCINDATVQNIRLHDSGHTWPVNISLRQSSKKILSSKTPDILWRFFMNHSL